MPVSDATYKRLLEANQGTFSGATSAAPEDASDTGSIEEARKEETVDPARYLLEKTKQGAASIAETGMMIGREVANSPLFTLPRIAASLAAPKEVERLKKLTSDENIEKALGVDPEVLKKDPGALASFVGPLFYGLGAAPGIFASGAGTAPVLDAATKTARAAAPGAVEKLFGPGKSALISMGASEVGDWGRQLGGYAGEYLGGLGQEALGALGYHGEPGKGEEAGKGIGAFMGSLAGGTAGGYANVVRANTAIQASKAVGQAGKASVSSVAPAMRAAFAAKKAGEAGWWDAFLKHYGDARQESIGWLQNRTNENVAEIITRDPRSKQAVEEFNNAAGAVLKPGELEITGPGGKENIFSVSQISDNPVLYKMEVARREVGKEEGAQAFARETARRKVLTDAFKRVTEDPLPTDQQSMEASINGFRAAELGRVTSMENDAAHVRSLVTNFTGERVRDNGTLLRQEFEKELGESRAVNQKLYEDSFALDTKGIDIAPARDTIKSVLDKFESQVKTGTAPESIENLNKFIEAKDTGRGKVIIVGEKPTDVRVPLRDVDSVVKSLGADSARYWRIADGGGDGAPAARMTARNLDQVREALLSTVNSTNPEAARAYAIARGRYQTDHAPRFNTGIFSAMEAERSTAGVRGRPKIVDEQLFNKILSKPELPTSMEEFDRTFGGFGGAKRNEEAFRLLGKAVEDRFSKEVLNEGFSVEKANQFASQYESALNRLPDVRERLGRTAERLDQIRAEQEAIADEFKALTGAGTLTEKIGSTQAEQLFVQALNDPGKMEKLLTSPLGNTPEKAKSIFKEAMGYANPVRPGGIDYSHLAEVMSAGQHRIDRPNTLEMLAGAAFGKDEGKAHLERLRMISELMRRDANVDPQHLRILEMAKSDSPVKDVTGQTTASWMTGFRSMNAGFGRNYFPLVSAGRFVNTQIQQAVDRTAQKALYDPQASKAVLTLATTPSNQPISRGLIGFVLDAVGGNREKIKAIVEKDLLEKGLVREMGRRGAIVGATSYMTDKERARKRDDRRREQGNIDLGE